MGEGMPMSFFLQRAFNPQFPAQLAEIPSVGEHGEVRYRWRRQRWKPNQPWTRRPWLR